MPQQTFGIGFGGLLGFRLGAQRGAADIKQVAPASNAQPLMITDQPIGNKGQAEGGDTSKKRIRGRGTKAGNEAGRLALEDRPADAHDADRTDRNGDHNPDYDALEEEYQKQTQIPPVRCGRSRAMLFGIAANFRTA